MTGTSLEETRQGWEHQLKVRELCLTSDLLAVTVCYTHIYIYYILHDDASPKDEVQFVVVLISSDTNDKDKQLSSRHYERGMLGLPDGSAMEQR